MNYEQHVARGMEALDGVMSGWETGIKLDSLALIDCGRCVLGQLFGDCSEGTGVMHLDLYMAYELGFSVNMLIAYGPDYYNADLNLNYRALVDNEYNALTKTWVEAIRKRLASVVKIEEAVEELVGV